MIEVPASGPERTAFFAALPPVPASHPRTDREKVMLLLHAQRTKGLDCREALQILALRLDSELINKRVAEVLK